MIILCDDDHHGDTDLHVCRGHLVDLRVVGPGQPHHLGPGLTRADLGGRHRLADEVSRALAGAVVTSLGPGALGAQCRGEAQEQEDTQGPRGSHHTILSLYCSVFIKWNLMFAQEPSLQMKLIVSLMEPVWIKTSFVLIVLSLQHYDCISLCIFSLKLFLQQRACVGRDPPRLVALYRLTTGPGHWPVWAAHGHW